MITGKVSLPCYVILLSEAKQVTKRISYISSVKFSEMGIILVTIKTLGLGRASHSKDEIACGKPIEVHVAYYSFCTMRALIYARAAQGTQEHHACAKSREPAEEIPRAQK